MPRKTSLIGSVAFEIFMNSSYSVVLLYDMHLDSHDETDEKKSYQASSMYLTFYVAGS